MHLVSRLESIAVVIALVCATPPAQSATLTWDGGGANNNWGTIANWNPDQAPANGDNLTFAGAVRTSSSNNLTGFVVDRFTFLASASSFTLSGNAFTIHAAVPGNGGYIHNGSANLQTINNNITFDGGGTINYLTSPTAGPMTFNGTIALINDGALTVGGASTVTLNGAISGAGTASGLALDTTASLVLLNGANTYTGQTRVFTGSTIRLGNNNRIADQSAVSVSGTLDLNGFSDIVGGLTGAGSVLLGGGTLQVSNGSDNSFSGSIGGTGSLVKAGSANLTLSGSNTYTGGTQIFQGTLTVSQFAANALPDSGSVLVQGGALNITGITEVVGAVTLDSGQIGGTGALQGTSFALKSGLVSAVLTGSSGIEKTTAGTVTLSGANTYTGATNISGGILQLGASNRLPATNVTISGGATLDMQTFSDTVGAVSLVNGSITGSGTLTTSGVTADGGTIGAVLAGSGGLTKNGTGTLTLTGANTYTGATTINAGVLALGSSSQRIADTSALTVNTDGIFRMNGFSETVGSLSGAGNVELGSGTLTVGGGTTSFSGAISGTGGLIRQGSGTLTLTGGNTYTGTTQVNGGALALGANNVIADGSNVQIGGGTFNIASFTDTVGKVTLQSGTIQGGAGLLRSDVGFFVESGSVNAHLTGSGGLTKSTTGVITLGSTATFTGATSVSDGTLRMAATNALPANSAVSIGASGILDLAGFAATIGGLAGSGTVALGTGSTLRIGANDQSTVFSGTLTGAPSASGIGGLTKIGAGSFTLSGSVQHAGGVRVEGGTLDLPNGLPLAGHQIDVAGGALTAKGFVNRSLSVSTGGAVAATGDLIIGDLAGSGSVFIQGTLNVGNHIVQLVGSSAASVAGSVLIAQGGRLTTFNQAVGTVLMAGGSVNASGDAAIDGNFVNQGTVHGPTGTGQFLTFTDDVRGPGAYTGNIRFADGFAPGSSPAVVSMQNASFDSSSNLVMELGGLIAGTQYDRLDVTGLLALEGGGLEIDLINGFHPQLGNEFDILDWGAVNGSFGSLALPTLAAGLTWNTGRLYLDGTISVGAVPEPGMWALLLAGLCAIVLGARRGIRPVSAA